MLCTEKTKEVEVAFFFECPVSASLTTPRTLSLNPSLADPDQAK